MKPILLLTSLLLLSCSKDYCDFEENIVEQLPVKVTRSVTSIPFNECNWCYLANGDSIKAPWADNTSTSIPLMIRKDVKQCDGWEIIYSNFLLRGSNHIYSFDNLLTYIILYNKVTGMLKGFYYATETGGGNNTAFWQLTLEGEGNPTLFNFAQEFAVSNDSCATNQISVANLTTNGLVGGFDRGWNCFMQELAYDPNSMHETMDITGYALNEATFTFTGAYQSTSSGTLVTSSSGLGSIVNSILSGLTGAFGDEAKSWIAANTASSGEANSNKPIKSHLASNILANVLSGSVSSITQYGLNKVFSSFLSYNTASVQTLQFSTHGNVAVIGNSSLPTTGLVAPLSLNLNALGTNLGVWNLAVKPSLEIQSRPVLVGMENPPYLPGYNFFYKATFTNQVNVVYNPDAPCAKSHSLSLTEYYGDMGPFFASGITFNVVDAYGSNRQLIYSDQQTIIKTMPQSYVFVVNNLLPNYKNANNKPVRDFQGNVGIDPNVYLKVVTTLSQNGNVAYSTKTFKPNCRYSFHGGDRPYQWTISELENLGY